MDQNGNAERFCWEQVLRTNPLFRISQLFSPPEYSPQLLALYALFASIEHLNSGISEESVARTKLEWWRAELLERDAADSNHPVVRYLHETGVAKKLPEPAVRRLLESAGARIDALAPADEEDLRSLCQAVYGPQVLLEAALEEGETALDSLSPAMLVNAGLVQLLRESRRRKENVFWWIPLNLLARFKVTRNQLDARQDSAVTQALFNQIFECTGQGAAGDVATALLDPQAGQVNRAELVHLRLMMALQARQLGRLKALSPARYNDELSRWRVGDLLTAWKNARQLKAKSAVSATAD
jgi:phytoene synthase